MAKLSFNAFGGSIPRLSPSLIKSPYSSTALNARLDTGSLRAWIEPALLQLPENKPDQKYVHIEDAFVSMPRSACVTDGDIAGTHYYVVEHGKYPEEFVVDEDKVLHYSRLGVPVPSERINAQPKDIGVNCYERDLEYRTYVYAYINRKGEEGNFSPAHTPIRVKDGTTVTVSGWTKPDDSWDVTHVAIYRTVTGYDSGKDIVNKENTYYMLVDVIPISLTSYTDTKKNKDLLKAKLPEVILPPVECLKGIIRISGTNTYAGFWQNRLYLTRNNQPFNWAIEYAVEDNIRGIAEHAGIIYVATDGYPYFMNAVVLDKDAEGRKLTRYTQPLPMVGTYSCQMVRLNHGVVYPSDNGLIFLQGHEAPVNLTEPFYTKEEWQRMMPDTAYVTEYGNHVYCFTCNNAFALSTFSTDKGGFDNHISLSIRDAHTAFTDRLGNMFVETPVGVYMWEAGSKEMPYVWVSPDIHLGVPTGLGKVVVNCDSKPVHITIKADDVVVLDRKVLAKYPMTLPLWAVGEKWNIKLTGVATVESVTIATINKEL